MAMRAIHIIAVFVVLSTPSFVWFVEQLLAVAYARALRTS